MIAVCCALAAAAIARGSTDCGTMSGRIAWMVGSSNARAMPIRNMITKIRSRVSQPLSDPSASAIAASTLATWVTAITTRRSQRSATCPTKTESETSGTN